MTQLCNGYDFPYLQTEESLRKIKSPTPWLSASKVKKETDLWSGLNISDCKSGIGALGGELSREKWRGLVFYLHEGCRLRGFRSGRIGRAHV